ncbi:STY0301 family protein [Dyella acidisoli]|uniref:Lipoprotein n=1 Tax=Dyella acidisoli TaxID=1867834 RepID=A0ABQ5XWQ6_9GAMM|nr:STY0301 family protein [Dyella acidisoli]GLQ95192.1 lipoprotein [Dyella acidisoli]
MSWSKRCSYLLLAFLLWFPVYGTLASDVCPSKQGTSLRFVDVFDGAPEDLATLVPDQAGKYSGYWQLGYVYDAGRYVTVRCKYANGQTLDVKLSDKVSKCSYTIDSKKTLALRCK